MFKMRCSRLLVPMKIKYVHSFFKQCFARASINTIWWYLELIFKLILADISWRYHHIVSIEGTVKKQVYCKPKHLIFNLHIVFICYGQKVKVTQINNLSRYQYGCETFEYEKQNIDGSCKQNLCFQFNLKLIQSKTWIFQFSQWP